ncbi:hypothetical protein ACIQCF_39055 [Streptomyces sp. NPDC088353]|uniref:hypothetical protein n=1 Tax=Streptomyces sp. NPDC088353 TaxID=3365855 RepID=UPI003825A756
MTANPLAPTGRPTRRHPKMLPDGARPSLLECVNTAWDAMVVQWLSDTAMRIGGLTGLHLVDLHLRQNTACGECSAARGSRRQRLQPGLRLAPDRRTAAVNGLEERRGLRHCAARQRPTRTRTRRES